MTWGGAVGEGQEGEKAWGGDGVGGVGVGQGADAPIGGTALGFATFAPNHSVSVGFNADCFSGPYAISIGGNDTDPSNNAVAYGQDTCEIGRGASVLVGGLNFRGHGLMDSSGTLRASFPGVVTNNGLVWYAVKTNANPSAFAAPNGSICTTTNGQFYVRSNAVWILK